MAGVASKNLYDLLGNDPDQDPDLRTPEPPVNPVDKSTQRAGKRNAPAEAPSRVTDQVDGRGRGGGERGRGRGDGRGRGRGRGRGGSDGAFDDSGAGRDANRSRPTGDDYQDRSGFSGERGRGRGRGRGGGRGGRGGNDDRHSHTVHSGPNDQAKQAAHGWGEETGKSELADERAGAEIAQQEQKEEPAWNSDAPIGAEGQAPGDIDQFGDGGGAKSGGIDQFGDSAQPAQENAAPAAEPEPEDNSKSYADYLAEQAQKKLALGSVLTARQANEGGKTQQEGTKVERAETDFFAGSGPKAGRQRERKEKNTVLLDHDFGPQEPPGGFRGGRGGRGRGEGRGRGRGEGGFRGDRDGGSRGDREGGYRGDREGGFRGGDRGDGRGRGRGEFRGRGGRGRGGGGDAPVNVSSAQDFPGLGGS